MEVLAIGTQAFVAEDFFSRDTPAIFFFQKTLVILNLIKYLLYHSVSRFIIKKIGSLNLYFNLGMILIC